MERGYLCGPFNVFNEFLLPRVPQDLQIRRHPGKYIYIPALHPGYDVLMQQWGAGTKRTPFAYY